MEGTRRRGRRRRKLLDDVKDRTGYSHLKEEALDRTTRTARFGRGSGPVIRHTTLWMNENDGVLLTFYNCAKSPESADLICSAVEVWIHRFTYFLSHAGSATTFPVISQPNSRLKTSLSQMTVSLPLGPNRVKVKVKITLEQATKAHRGSRGVALLFP
jgi:hypothetical protein